MATPSKNLDRRAQRTRQMLRQAFIEVAREKGVMTISVQEITERANVSRGTFYAHYTDKYALIEAIVRDEFQNRLKGLPLEERWSRETLRLLIRAVLEYFKEIYQRHYRSGEIGPILERAVHEELKTVLLNGLKSQHSAAHPQVAAETVAQVMSWAIFGAALQWSRTNNSPSADRMAEDILVLLLNGVAPFMPELSPD